ncbi:acetate--CoA ligase family protein [Sphaerisporangium fuscum]|uniref:acetate--CoA ligase family protein n=1 Tax=Sphaerisporangium fuscum TaxID=2835868 RepID=UPI001BDDB139|nr:acetate--CoA ligase family protein [Sphaerisporangium fuscum]
MIHEHEVKALLRDAGVAVPRGVTASRPAEITGAAEVLAPPLVLKAYGPGLLHKSDAGAVRLGLASAAQAARAAEEMRGRLAAQGITPEGFLVEEQAAPGVELIVGLVRDPAFGPAVLAGLGGVWTEIMRDTALRLCPIGEADAREMLASLRGAPLLSGHRGTPAADLGSLVELLVRLAGEDGLWRDLDLGEFELNPVIASPAGAVAVDARHIPSGRPSGTPRGPAAMTDFTALFEPKKVAVVGASTTRPNFGNMFLEFYKLTGVPLVAVHPEAAEIAGVPAVPSLSDSGADYALVAVPATRCPDVVRQAAGVPFVQVMSGGFGELGHPELEEDLVTAAREAGTRLLGPNCMGVYSPRGRQTFVGGEQGRPGSVALISQSGGLAGEVVKVGERRGLAFSRVATVGNSLDVTPAELLRWLAADPETAVVGLYLEDPRDGRALLDALMAVRGRMPVSLLVGGRSAQGRRAAASHTGGLAGEGRVWQAVADQCGAALVASQDDLIGTLAFFQAHAARADVPGDPGVLVIGPSGGAAVLAADVLDGAGLALDPLPPQARDALTALGLGVGSSLANPLEIPVGPRARPDLVREAIAAIQARRPYPDVVAHVNVQSFFTYGDTAEPLYAYTRHLAETQALLPGTRITLVTRNGECAPPGVEDEVRAVAAAGGIPVYRSVEAAAVAVAAGKRHARARAAATAPA